MMPLPPDPVQVLLVADDADIGQRVFSLLSGCDNPVYRIHHTNSPSEARQLGAHGAVDVVLVDLALATSGEAEALHRLWEAEATPPVVVLAGQADDALGLQAIRRGAQDLLCRHDLSAPLLSRTLHLAVERHRSQEERRLWAKAFEVSEAMMITDATGTILGINPAFTTVTGYSPEETVGKRPSFLNSGWHDADFYSELWRAVQDTGSWSGEIWNCHRSGRVFPVQETITVITNGEGQPTHYVAILSDITDRKRLETELESLASHDALTSVFNRGRLSDFLDHELARCGREAIPFSLILLDIDNFKRINDTYGHRSGDEVLRGLTRRLEANLRQSDLLGRWGGEEFLILLPNTDQAGAQTTAEKLRAVIETADLGVPDQITISLGVATYGRGDDASTLVDRADQAVYRAKAAGRNRATDNG